MGMNKYVARAQLSSTMMHAVKLHLYRVTYSDLKLISVN